MWSLPFEEVDMVIAAGNADTCMNAFIGGAEELDIVRLLLQPIQLGPAGCTVYDKYCSIAFVAITVLLPWLFFALQSESSYIKNCINKISCRDLILVSSIPT